MDNQNKFQYYLTDEDGKFYYVENDEVKLSVEPVVLPQTPSGWQDLLIGWERNVSKYGIVRSFTLPLRFVMDGARIIRELFYKSNVEKEIRLLITKLNLNYTASSFKYYYSNFYEGELDLSTFKDEAEEGVSVNVVEGSYAKKLKANEATPFEIPFEFEKIRVKLDGIYLYQKFNYLIQAGGLFEDHTLGMLEAGKEGGGAGLASFTTYLTRFDGDYRNEDFNNRTDYFLAFTQDITNVRIQGSIKFTSTSPDTKFRIFLITNTGREIGIIDGPRGTYNFNFTIDGFAGENFFLVGTGGFSTPIVYLETSITIDFKSRYASTYAYAYKPLDLYKKLAGGKVLGEELAADSTLLEDNASLCVTCGDAIRGLEGAKIKTSLNNFFEAYNTILNAGLSLEGDVLRFEDKAYFFNALDPIALGPVKDLKLSVATDLMANTIKIGYPVQNTDDVNGKSAFNNTHVYSSPVTRVVKELALICPYITDPFAIELYRLNLDKKETTDNSSDNEVMILNVDLDNPQSDNLGTYYNLKRETYTTITGVPDPDSTFNIEQLTPKTLLFTHQSYMDSIFYGFENEDLKFQTTEKNADLYRELSGVTVDENADFTITDAPYFIPFYVEFDTEVPVDLASILGVNPNRCFSFEWKGQTWEGFVMKAAIAPNDNKPQAFKVLLTPNNDLTRLI